MTPTAVPGLAFAYNGRTLMLAHKQEKDQEHRGYRARLGHNTGHQEQPEAISCIASTVTMAT